MAVPTESDLVEIQVDSYKAKGLDINPPKPNKDLRELLLIASDLGWPFKGNFILPLQNVDLKGLKIPFEEHYFWYLRHGMNRAKGGYWVAVDTTQRPGYFKSSGNIPSYPNDYLGPTLAGLIEEGGIALPNNCRSITKTSRFGVSFREIHGVVSPEVAEPLGINKQRLRVPFAEEAIILGNIFYPYFVVADSPAWEWYYNIFGSYRLLGGRSGHKGLTTRVTVDMPGTHIRAAGFRFLSEFPTPEV